MRRSGFQKRSFSGRRIRRNAAESADFHVEVGELGQQARYAGEVGGDDGDVDGGDLVGRRDDGEGGGGRLALPVAEPGVSFPPACLKFSARWKV